MARAKKSEAEVKPIVEAILFAVDRPIPAAKLSRAVEGTDVRIVRKCVEQLNAEYEESNRSFQIEEIAGGYQVLTRPEFWKWVSKIRQTRTDAKLSPAALETLAIAAYKQPVLRADIEAIRGVQSGELLRGLLERGLIKVVGRQDTIGRPILYGTTRRFLEQLGLNSIKNMPRMDQLGPQGPLRPAPDAPSPDEAVEEEPGEPQNQADSEAAADTSPPHDDADTAEASSPPVEADPDEGDEATDAGDTENSGEDTETP